MLVALLIVPSLLLQPMTIPRGFSPLRTVAMVAAEPEMAPVEAAEPEVAPVEADEAEVAAPPPSPAYSEEETRLRAMAEAWDSADASSKSSMTAEISQLASAPNDAASLKAQLMGSWKLMFTSDADSVATTGLSGFAGEQHTFVEGHFQKFIKPDPMDIFNGGVKDKFYMETFEVISDVFKGSTTLAALKGGYYVGELSSMPLGVLETYTRRELEGTSVGDGELRNGWACTYVTETIRVCKADNGSYRVYDKVDDAALHDGVASLRAKEIPIDQEMLTAWQEETARKAEELKKQQEFLDPEDDPNDTRPLWQKRIDKADGIKRTANGTPIINHGPIGGGPTGPPTK